MTDRPTPAVRRARRSLAAAAALLLAAACAPRTLKLPSAPGAPAGDGAAALAQATAACRGVRTLSAEVAVSGRVAAQKVRGRMTTGVAAPASARIEAVAPFGAPVFIFVASGDEATLLLPRDGRVLPHGRAGAVLEAVSGVPLGPAELRDVLSGCPTGAADAAGARQAGDDWRVVPGADETLYLNRARRADPWRLVALVHGAGGADGTWRAEYRGFENGLPRAIHLAGGGAARFDLDLALSQVDLNVPLGPEVFRVEIPTDAQPITLEELRANGPLADRKK